MHSVQMGILLAQWRYGSLFFLPNKFRAQTFDSYIQYVKEETIDSSENRWRLCTNSFCDPDLGYNDNKSSIKYTKITKLSYFHLPWGHNFHPKWILQRLEEKHWCPVWDEDVPKNVYTQYLLLNHSWIFRIIIELSLFKPSKFQKYW